MKTIKIGIIDDHDIVRRGLRELLHSLGGYEVIAEYDSAREFADVVDTIKTHPDVYLLDYSMPGMTGVDLLHYMRQKPSGPRFLILTQHAEPQFRIDAYQAGARGFLNKSCSARELKQAIDRVVETGFDNFNEILALMRNPKTADEFIKSKPTDISDREMQLLELVCSSEELTYQQIADRMRVSIKSVDAYRSTLFQKLDVKSKVGLVLYSYHHNMTAPFK